MLKLMAYADGELEGDERAEVEAWLRTDAQALRTANAFAELGEIVTEGHPLPPFDIADEVMAAVKEEPKVVHLQPRRRAAVYTAVGAALAVAAAFALTMRAKSDEQPMARVAPTTVEQSTGVDVDVNETPGHSVSVFHVPSETNPTTSVIVWVDETGEK